MSVLTAVESAREALGFHKVIALHQEFAVSTAGRERVGEIAPLAKVEDILLFQQQISALKRLMEEGTDLPLSAFEDERPELKRCQLKGTFLGIATLQHIRADLAMIAGLLQTYRSQRTTLSPLEALFKNLNPLTAVKKLIDRLLDAAGNIRDNASPDLQTIRTAARVRQQRLQRSIVRLMEQARTSGWLHEENPTLREGRLVLPLRSEFKRKVNGIIHGQSATGATTYIEPLEIVEINNELKELEQAEKEEIERILLKATEQLRPSFDALRLNYEQAIELDSRRACTLYSRRYLCQPPRINVTERRLCLQQARHPLLVLVKPVVPLSISLGEEVRIVLISGPNAGGKTVAMKTVGLLVLMAMSGLHIPADTDSTIPLLTNFLTDIGDQQSLENDLSTFSSHVRNLKDFLDEADGRTLVLIDELGTGTEPTEGAALGQAVLEMLAQSGALTLATTHHNALKEFVQRHPGALNAAMEFDTATLAPTYRLQVGLPGNSYAFEISRRLGLAEKVIARAQSILGMESLRLTALLQEVEDLRKSTAAESRQLDAKQKVLDRLVAEQTALLNQLREKEKQADATLVQQLEQVVASARQQIEQAIKTIRENNAHPAATKQARQVVARLESEIGQTRARLKEPPSMETHELETGDWVKIEGLTNQGEIVSFAANRKRVAVRIGDKTLWIASQNLQRVRPPTGSKAAPAAPVIVNAEKPVSPRLDLRGLRADEAESMLVQFLDRALIAGLNQVEIIHGMGTGALQKMTHQVLRNHPRVRHFHFEDFDSGGTGATLVEL